MLTAADVRSIPIFAGLADDQIAFVASRAADLRLRAGDVFVHEGETPSFFASLSGRFEVFKRYGTSERQLALREPGAYIGEIPIVLGSSFFAGARALEPCRLLRLEARDFRRLLRADRTLHEDVLKTVLQRVEGLEEEVDVEDVPPIVVGSRYDSACHDLRDFLARNRLPFEWHDPGDGLVCEAAGTVDPADTPLVIVEGRRLVRPSLVELAEAVGLQTRPRKDCYDVVVIGGGPAGLAAAVYGASEGLETVLFEQLATGGQAGTSSRIENYLGFPSGLSGDDLATRAHAQAARFGAELIVAREVLSVEPRDGVHRITYGAGSRDADGGSPRATIEARAVVIATGVAYRKLDVPGIDRFLGASVFYGAARTEAVAMQGRHVILVGGGNSAGQAAMFFANYARRVTILIRGASLHASMSQYLIDQLATKENIAVRAHGAVVGVHGKDGSEALQFVTIRDTRTGVDAIEEASAVFVFIGADAMTEWLPEELVRDERGYICTGRDVLDLIGDARPWPHERDPYFLETSIPGIFAAGDVRHGSIKRVAAGVGEGSMSIALVHAYLASLSTDAVLAGASGEAPVTRR